MAKQRSAITVVLVSMLFAALLLSAGANPARSSVGNARSSLAPQSITLEAVADTYVHEALPSHNFGSQSEVQVGHSTGSETQTLLRFNLSSLPQYAHVTGATLSLSPVVNLSAAQQTIQQTLTVWADSANVYWNETGVTWTTRPGFTNLGDPPTAVGTGLGRTSWNVTNIVDARDGQRAGPTAGDRVRDPDADADPHADAHGKPYPHSDQYPDPHAECHGTADPHADPKADQHPYPHAQVRRHRQLPGPGVGLR